MSPLAICEDLWQEGGPVAVAREAEAGLLLVINGSPYERNKDDVRLRWCRRRAAEAGCALAYVNMVGGQDELVFDGDSLVVDADGDAAGPRRAVHRGAARRRPRPAAAGRRPTSRDASTADGRGRPHDRARRARRAAGRASRRRARRPSRLSDDAEVYARARPRACATTSTRTASAPSCSACPAGSTRRWSRPSPCDAIGAGERASASPTRATTPPSTPGPTRPSWPGVPA